MAIGLIYLKGKDKGLPLEDPKRSHPRYICYCNKNKK